MTWEQTLKGIRRTAGWRATAPSDAELDDASDFLDLRLPESYRQFTKRVGAGTLSGLCEFYSCGSGVEDRTWDLLGRNLLHARCVLKWYDEADERVRRMVVFGSVRSSDEFGWDPAEAAYSGRDKERVEYAVYTVNKFRTRTVRLASTFPEFVTGFCMGRGLPAYTGHDEIDFARNRFTRVGLEPC